MRVLVIVCPLAIAANSSATAMIGSPMYLKFGVIKKGRGDMPAEQFAPGDVGAIREKSPGYPAMPLLSYPRSCESASLVAIDG
jgi:hypothetical protein